MFMCIVLFTHLVVFHNLNYWVHVNLEQNISYNWAFSSVQFIYFPTYIYHNLQAKILSIKWESANLELCQRLLPSFLISWGVLFGRSCQFKLKQDWNFEAVSFQVNVVEDLNQHSCSAVVWMKSWLKDKNPFPDSEGYLAFYFIISFVYHLISYIFSFRMADWFDHWASEGWGRSWRWG